MIIKIVSFLHKYTLRFLVISTGWFLIVYGFVLAGLKGELKVYFKIFLLSLILFLIYIIYKKISKMEILHESPWDFFAPFTSLFAVITSFYLLFFPKTNFSLIFLAFLKNLEKIINQFFLEITILIFLSLVPMGMIYFLHKVLGKKLKILLKILVFLIYFLIFISSLIFVWTQNFLLEKIENLEKFLSGKIALILGVSFLGIHLHYLISLFLKEINFFRKITKTSI